MNQAMPKWAQGVAQAIMETVKSHDTSVHDHCVRVGIASGFLAKVIGLDQYEQKVAAFSGLFHDIGKVSISHKILHKPGKLTREEMEVMKSHPVKSANIIEHLSEDPFFKDLIPGVKHHHERIDGNGYPDGLKADEIPLISRIILIVDTYDAMSQNRAYRQGLPDEVIYKEMNRCSGTQFDENLVKLFLEAHQFGKERFQNGEEEHFLIAA